jgi:hypothetical protein
VDLLSTIQFVRVDRIGHRKSSEKNAELLAINSSSATRNCGSRAAKRRHCRRENLFGRDLLWLFAG